MFVSRRHIWNTSLPYFERSNFIRGHGYLQVIFTAEDGHSEEGVDLGGPRREYFRVLLQAMARYSGLLAGNVTFYAY